MQTPHCERHLHSGSSFHTLLARLVAEHDREVEDLRAENARLASACRSGGVASSEEFAKERAEAEKRGQQLLLPGQLEETPALLKDIWITSPVTPPVRQNEQQVADDDAELLNDRTGLMNGTMSIVRSESVRDSRLDGHIKKFHGEDKSKHLGRFVELFHMDPTQENTSLRIEQLQTLLREKMFVISTDRLQAVVAEMMRAHAGLDLPVSATCSSLTQPGSATCTSQLGSATIKNEVRTVSSETSPVREATVDRQGTPPTRSKSVSWSSRRLRADSLRTLSKWFQSEDVEPSAVEHSAVTEEIDLVTFVEVIVDPDLPTRVQASYRQDVTDIRQLLLQQDIDEIITKVTRLRKQSDGTAIMPMVKDRVLFRLNVLVSVTVLLSVAFLGVSMDYSPGSGWWILLEALFATVFVVEFFVKLRIEGGKKFFRGHHRMGNMFDVTITLVALLDVAFSSVMLFGPGSEAVPSTVSAGRISLVLRCVRLARIARLVKLFKGPFLKELANMLSGFFIGLPSLIWVMVLLAAVIYILALLLKSVLGPPQREEPLMHKCGSGDLGSWDDPECTACTLFAEEYLHSVKSSMMVVFRCVVGDCTSKAGQSLSAHLSGCYAWKFDVVYFLGMVTIIFGIFNIITAIFVQATMEGLQFNHVQNKYAQMYESHYMRRKLEALVDRIRHIYHIEMESTPKGRSCAKFDDENNGSGRTVDDCHLTESVFYKVLQDAVVNSLFEDLDVKIDHRLNTFQFFDISNDGRVSLVELIQTLMKMRGEPHKSDLVASWALLEDFRSQFFEFQKTSLANQKEMFGRQRDIIKTMMAFRQEELGSRSAQEFKGDDARRRKSAVL